AREIRRRAQEAEAAQVERDRLADENATLRDELASLREQLEAAKTAGSPTDQSVPSADEARQLAHHYVEVWTAVKAALGQIGTTAASLTARDLQRLMDDHPALFKHLSAASIEKYLAWLAMVERAKREVRRKLDAMGYDTEAWREIPDFPTIVEGVRRRGVKAEKWH